MISISFPKKVVFKAADDTKLTLEALGYQTMVEEILDVEWVETNLFYIGAKKIR
ncbi:hypothetical protein LOAG_10432 [Loa loa]|uniref:Uncharacterized protein n=1 Tax=Loa loa TaxID=7209 RepID=A0A1S0TQF8_LOALO|nr:hypothetical protein LOAG_10432 [Loa loa]EFO18067.2 hypothetical protein LOAG_10432 [Loa loa]